jgi:AmmeMemoRadiSam system protein B
MDTVRAPAVAGTFYPGSPAELGATVDRLLAEAAKTVPQNARRPKGLIVPHAGYVYSGPIAANAFARVAPYGASIERVVLVGPAHRMFVGGLVAPGASKLRTPLGEMRVDVSALEAARIASNAAAHAREHSLEVELPFLQRVAPNASIVPLAGTRAEPELVGRTLAALWGGPETLIVISSDLSHYLPYLEGRRVDEKTCEQILEHEMVDGENACGSIGLNGLAWLAKARGNLSLELLDLRSSGDTAGGKDEVVGYAAFAIYEEGVPWPI